MTKETKPAETVADIVENPMALLDTVKLDALNQYMESVQAAIANFGESAVEVGLWALRLDAAAALVPGLLWCVLSLILATAAKRAWPKHTKPPVFTDEDRSTLKGLEKSGPHYSFTAEGRLLKALSEKLTAYERSISCDLVGKYRNPFESSVSDAVTFASILPSAGALVAGAVGATQLANIWAWAGLFAPELYAVHKFLLN